MAKDYYSGSYFTGELSAAALGLTTCIQPLLVFTG
jgi:hypothetical protein